MILRTRRANVEDADNLALVGSATFLETFAGVLDGIAIIEHCAHAHSANTYREYLSGAGESWLAETEAGGAPVGYMLLSDADLPGSQTTDLELKRIYLLSRFQGSGVGAELMSLALERARARGAGRLLLGVYVGNARAISFYRRHGFEQVADRKFRVGHKDYDDIVLAKALS